MDNGICQYCGWKYTIYGSNGVCDDCYVEYEIGSLSVKEPKK